MTIAPALYHIRALRTGGYAIGRVQDAAPTGGATVVVGYDALLDRWVAGVAACHPRDQYNKRIGRTIAIGRMVTALVAHHRVNMRLTPPASDNPIDLCVPQPLCTWEKERMAAVIRVIQEHIARRGSTHQELPVVPLPSDEAPACRESTPSTPRRGKRCSARWAEGVPGRILLAEEDTEEPEPSPRSPLAEDTEDMGDGLPS